MRQPGIVFLSALLIALSGCSTAPVSFEESLTTHRATRNDVPDWDTEMRYRVGFQYANAARKNLSEPGVTIPSKASYDFQIPFAVLDYSLGDDLGAGLSIVDWFNSGLSENSRYVHYYNRGLGFMVHPNTHYFTFDERSGKPSAEEVRAAWDEAHTLFLSIHNASGECYVHGYNAKDQYRVTFSKDVPGLWKEVSYWCPHPVLNDREHRVSVTAWANPYSGIRVMGAVQSQCYRTLRGEDFIDVRACGMSLADRQAARIPESRFGWMELIVTPQSDDPSVFEVVARSNGPSIRLPAPETTEKYQQFLSGNQ